MLSARDVPFPSTLVFNARVAKYQGKYVMLFRNDYDAGNGRLLTNMGLALSDNGLDWHIQRKSLTDPRDGFTELRGSGSTGDLPGVQRQEIPRVHDPRLTVMDGRCFVCFPVETPHGIRSGISVTDDFERFELVHLSVPDHRDMVLFPERIRGRHVRLERPFPTYMRSVTWFDVWRSWSPDLR